MEIDYIQELRKLHTEVCDLKKKVKLLQNGVPTDFDEIDPFSVHLTGPQTITGIKTFTNPVNGVAAQTDNQFIIKSQLPDKDFISVLDFGAVGDGEIDDTAAFLSAISYLESLELKKSLFIPAGRYAINQKLIIHGGISGSAPYIRGEGGRSTILDFSGSTDNVAIQWGTDAIGSNGRDTLHGGIKGLRIIGTPTMDGLTIASAAPTSNAFNRFEDLFITNVRDGLNELTGVNTSSNYSNHFENIDVQGHSGIALYIKGVYSTYKGIFLVSPQGSGANTLALQLEGAGNTIESIQTEDQIYILGRNNVIQNLSMEYILKSVHNSVIQGNAIRISNTNNHIDGLTMTGFKNTIIDTMASIAGASHSIKNAVYFDESNPLYAITYPFFPSAESSGIMENIKVTTGILLDNASLDGYLQNWSLTNVQGIDGLFSRDRNLILGEEDPLSLHLTGGRVTGTVYLEDAILGRKQNDIDNDIVTGSMELWGLIYVLGNMYMLKKDESDFQQAIIRDITGSEAVWNYKNVGTIEASGTIKAANATLDSELITKAQLDDKKAIANADAISSDATDLPSAIILINELKEVVNSLQGKLRVAGLLDE